MSGKKKILKTLGLHEQEMKDRFKIKRIGLFGSFARGEETDTSDIDILVELEVPTYDNFIHLAFYLDDLFNGKVDMVTTGGLSPYILPNVENDVIWLD